MTNDTFEKMLKFVLEKEYFDKCFVQISPTSSEQVCGTNSYYEMVQNPYNLQKNRIIIK